MRSFIIKGLLPWILLFAFLDGSLVALKMGVFGGLICLLILNHKALIRGFVFDWLSLLYLVFLLIMGVVNRQPLIIQYGLGISYAVLTLFCFLTLLIKKPFALVYARTQIEQAYWHNAILERVCYLITWVWAMVFLIITCLAGVFYYGVGTKLWMIEILPTALIILSIGFTILFPDTYKNWHIKKGGVASIPGISDVKQLTLGSIRIAYRSLGQGPLVILLQGSHINMHSWDPDFLKKLAEHYQVLILDYPGIGHSTYEKMPYTVEKIATVLDRFIEKLNLKPVALIGYSLGGMIAQTFMASFQYKLKALVLIATEIAGPKNPSPDQEVLSKLYDEQGSTEDRAKRLMHLMFPSNVIPRVAKKMHKIFNTAAMEGLVSDEMLEKQEELEEKWRKEGLTTEVLSSLLLHYLIITGLQDQVVSPENAKLLNQTLKGSKLVEYEDAGHGVVYQYPLDIADQIVHFLSEINIC